MTDDGDRDNVIVGVTFSEEAMKLSEKLGEKIAAEYRRQDELKRGRPVFSRAVVLPIARLRLTFVLALRVMPRVPHD